MAEKRNIFLIGPMGAGKSTIGRQLAQNLGMSFFDSDDEIVARSGVDIDWIFDLEGEEGFRLREHKMLAELTSKHGIVLSTGGGAVMLKENRNMLSARGIVVYLQTSIEKQLERTSRDKKRPLLQTDDPERALRELAQIRDPLYRETADIIIETDDQGAKAMAQQIERLIDEF